MACSTACIACSLLLLRALAGAGCCYIGGGSFSVEKIHKTSLSIPALFLP